MQCEQQDLAVTIVWMGGGDQQQVLQVLSAAGGRVVREWLQEKKTDVWGCDSWSRLDSILCVSCYIRLPNCFGRCHVMKDNTALTPTTQLTPATLSGGDHWKKKHHHLVVVPKSKSKKFIQNEPCQDQSVVFAVISVRYCHFSINGCTCMPHVWHMYATCMPHVWHM